MFTKVLLVALAASPLVAAHGKVAVVTADQGGNTTALGILGGIVPGPGKNKVTEVDTTVFRKVNPLSDGLGKTAGNGKNTLAGMSAIIAQSGDVLPQVSDGGSISGIWHTVTTDGAGPVTMVLDTTGTGAFSQGTKLEVTQQVPGNNGNIRAPKDRRFFRRALIAAGIVKRASNVNTDEPMAANIPAGTTCTGTVGGQTGVCAIKIANTNRAGPFGGVIFVQMAGAGGAAPGTADTATEDASDEADASEDNTAVQTEADTKRSFIAKHFSA